MYKGKSIVVPEAPQEMRKYKCHNVDGHDYFVKDKYTPRRILTSRAPYGVGHFWTFFLVKDIQNVTILKIDDPFEHIVRAVALLREVQLLNHLNHPNIIALKDIMSPAFDGHSFQEVYLVYELMDSDLRSVIHSGTVCPNDYCRRILYQIFCALKHAHSADILVNLDPVNIFVNPDIEVKLGDFGISWLQGHPDMLTKPMVRAPETLAQHPVYNACNNVWGAGVVFMQLLSSGQILPGAENEQHLSMIVELLGTPPANELSIYDPITIAIINNMPVNPRIPLPQKFPNFDPLAMDLADKMLAFNPTQRITVDEALAHPYLKPVRCKKKETVCTELFNFDLNETLQLPVETIKGYFHEISNTFTDEADSKSLTFVQT